MQRLEEVVRATAMNPFFSPSGAGTPRPQADRIARLIAQEGWGFRGALLGKRREGKTDLLRQIRALLFRTAEGPIPFFYSFHAGRNEGALANHFVAAFFSQVRAFVMRNEELLREPSGSLDQELEKPGLPLALSEMGHHFLALPPERQCEFAPTVPAVFASREARPVCVLLDDTHELSSTSPYFAALDSPNLFWLLAGRSPFLARMAGDAEWPVIRLEPFSGEEALLQARRWCEAAGLPFARRVWEHWTQMAGTSLWRISSLVTAAAVRGQRLDSVEQLGRLYMQELVSGTMGNWLSARFERAIPDRGDRTMVGEHLARLARSGVPTGLAGSLPSRVWDGLVAEEWAEEAAAGPQLRLDTVLRDWLSLSAAPRDEPPDRARSRLQLAFLLRGEQSKERPETARFSTVMRQPLLDLPQSGLPELFPGEGQEIRLPKILSVCSEAAPPAELFWCYGESREVPGTGIVLLIAVCDEPPTDSQLQRWNRQLENEARLFEPGEAAPARARPSLRQELWVVVPPETTLVPAGTERRFSWQAFFHLVVQAGSPEYNPPSTVGE